MAPSFVEENENSEAWLHTQCDVVKKGLKAKYKRMASHAFDFLRATCFRWASGIKSELPELADTPIAVSVGDLHAENYGTWRDVEGRWVWGVNDFDEAAEIPFAYDLARLATSVALAPNSRVSDHNAAWFILKGYRNGLSDPKPTLLEENETWMRRYLTSTEKDLKDFWDDVEKWDEPPGAVPDKVEFGLRQALPDGAVIEQFKVRQTGGGSLGRPRYMAIASWRGGRVVREAKALVPSAWNWAHRNFGSPIRFDDLATGAHRSPDPYLRTRDRFVFRRVAADSRKLDLEADPKQEWDGQLLEAMGFDLAAIHAASVPPHELRKALDAFEDDWLEKASERAAEWVKDDFHEWKKHYKAEK